LGDLRVHLGRMRFLSLNVDQLFAPSGDFLSPEQDGNLIRDLGSRVGTEFGPESHI
jgi:hypothetical protein